MALDPKFAAMLEVPGMQLGAPPPEVTPAMMREGARALLPPVEPPPVHEVRELEFRGPAGSLRARLYRPSARDPLPTIVFLHGGGFVLCDLDSHDVTCRTLANLSGCAVLAVDYRLAPETRFPGPLEDAYAALQWAASAGAAHGIDGTRLAVAGDSAGGNLAAAVALLARERGGPRILHQGLICPVTDAACDTRSMHELATGYMLSRDLMQWFWQCYLSRPEDGANPLASPLRASALAGLPPATILTAEFDPLRDEGEAYADRLRAAGVPVVARMYPGMIHDFPQMPLVTEVAERALADLAHDVRAALGGAAAVAGAGVDRVAVAKALYDAALAQDWAAVGRLVTDDFTIVESPALPFAGEFRGKDAFQQLFAAISQHLTMKDVRVHSRVAAGEQVVVFATLVVDRGGRDEPLDIVEVLTFRGDRICHVKPYYFDAALVRACSKTGG